MGNPSIKGSSPFQDGQPFKGGSSIKGEDPPLRGPPLYEDHPYKWVHHPLLGWSSLKGGCPLLLMTTFKVRFQNISAFIRIFIILCCIRFFRFGQIISLNFTLKVPQMRKIDCSAVSPADQWLRSSPGAKLHAGNLRFPGALPSQPPCSKTNGCTFRGTRNGQT